MLKLSTFCLKTYNLENTAIIVIIIKRLTRKSQPHKGISEISYSHNSTHITQENIYKEVLPNNTAEKVIQSVVSITPIMQKHLNGSLETLGTVIPSYK